MNSFELCESLVTYHQAKCDHRDLGEFALDLFEQTKGNIYVGSGELRNFSQESFRTKWASLVQQREEEGTLFTMHLIAGNKLYSEDGKTNPFIELLLTKFGKLLGDKFHVYYNPLNLYEQIDAAYSHCFFADHLISVEEPHSYAKVAQGHKRYVVCGNEALLDSMIYKYKSYIAQNGLKEIVTRDELPKNSSTEQIFCRESDLQKIAEQFPGTLEGFYKFYDKREADLWKEFDKSGGYDSEFFRGLDALLESLVLPKTDHTALNTVYH